MVEIEEITDEQDTAKKEETSDTTNMNIPKGKKLRKELPSVAHMLAHGSPESQGRPKTFCDVFGYPIFVAICFAISLLIFHYAPHDKSVQPKGKFSIPKRQQQHHQYQRAVPVPPTAGSENVILEGKRQEPPPETAGGGGTAGDGEL